MKRTFLPLLTLLFVLLCYSVGAQPLRVFLIGDSTCATKDLAKQNPERGWGHLFQPLFDGDVVVENHAVNGRSTKSFRDLGHWQRVHDKLQSGDYLFIQFGHNDGKLSDTVRYASPDDYEANLRRYVREARAKGAHAVLLTPIRRRHFKQDTLIETHGEYPDRMRRVAADEGVILLETEPATREWLVGLGDEASKPYFMQIPAGVSPLYPDGKNDNTHLNVRGAHVVARQVARLVAAQIPALGAHLVMPDFVVAKDGSGDFFTLSEAVAALPDFCRDTTHIILCEGTYREKVVIPATKRNVVVEARGEVTIAWDDYASKIGSTGHEIGTSGSATVYFGGDNWLVRGITFANTAGSVGQAVAVQCLAHGLWFIDCRFLGDQDTLYLYASGNREGERVAESMHMLFEGCYIEGTTDFIFGAASARFRDCEIHSKRDSYITAASTCRGQTCGLIFDRCRLTAAAGITKCYLGRPWREHAQTVFISCELGAHIRPEGWHDWRKPEAHKRAFYAEYNSLGPGAAAQGRVKWSHQLSAKQAQRVIEAFEKSGCFR